MSHLQNIQGARDIDFICRQWILDAPGHAGTRRLVGYSFDPAVLDQFPEKRQVENGTLTKMKSVMAHQGLDIFQLPGAEVVQNGHFVTEREQTLGNMAADESGSACD
jgi:hypothetical protein